MQSLPVRHVAVTITLIAADDERARAVIDEMTMTHGSILAVQIDTIIIDAPTEEPPPS
jgi:hypothetical protein